NLADPKNRLSLSRPLSRLHVTNLNALRPAPAATPMAARGVGRERQIDESGIEQTVVAFDVTLKMPTSQQGTAGLLCPPNLKARRSRGEELGCSKRPRM